MVNFMLRVFYHNQSIKSEKKTKNKAAPVDF